MSITLSQFLLEIIFLTVIYLHITKKNFGGVLAYSIQSAIIVILLSYSFFTHGNISLLALPLLVLLVKVIFAPIFFVRLIQKYHLTFLPSTYCNIPLTLIIIVALVGLAYSQKFSQLVSIIPAHHDLLALALATMLCSLFLIINRKSALSQIIGILSFENSIVAFALFAGLEQSFTLQIGIIFDIIVWLIIARVFMAMVYQHFGSLDLTSMKNLKD